MDTKRLLSHDELRLGKAELYLGDPAAARKHFQKAFALRTAWSEAEPEKAEPSSYVMEARMWLGVANSHLGDTEARRDHFDQAVQIGEALVRKHPESSTSRATWQRCTGPRATPSSASVCWTPRGTAIGRRWRTWRQWWHATRTIAPETCW